MKERPILFTTPMVQAILDGRKTMTRRIIKLRTLTQGNTINYLGQLSFEKYILAYFSSIDWETEIKCPYGVPGDQLWVKETFENELRQINYKACNNEVNNNPAYASLTKWTPSIFMPKVASRITLKIIDIQVERLHDISDTDILKEGVVKGTSASLFGAWGGTWGGINGYQSWISNPWVWVIEFERLT